MKAWAVWWLAGMAVPALAARDLSTDRPDSTESPFTVEPGRFQIETSLASFARDQRTASSDDARTTLWNVMPTNLRFGLTPQWELQIVVDAYLDETSRPRTGGPRVRQRGFGDITLRTKVNLWGNDGGDTAFGLLPFVKLPTASDGLGNDAVEGGLIAAFAGDLAPGWSYGAMTEVDVVRNERDDGYEPVWVNTFTVGHDLTERLGLFTELALEVGPGPGALSFNAGVTYALGPDQQVDAGFNRGLTRAAPDLVLFVGFSRRF